MLKYQVIKPLGLAGLLISLVLLSLHSVRAQGGGFTIYGDVKVDDSQMTGLKPDTFEVILQSQRLTTVGRQSVPKGGRFRFENLTAGVYYISVLLDGSEVANVRVRLIGIVGTDVRQDIVLEWKPKPGATNGKGGVISAARYTRPPANRNLFDQAEEATRAKDYKTAKSLLERLIGSDPQDFEALTELGTVEFMLKNNRAAEKAYRQALEAEPSFLLALINLGKLKLAENKYDEAIEVLSKAVTVPPPSAEANYFLGEAYLGTKKGSKAVAYMNEALRIEPVARAEIHLRIAAIYDNVGLKYLAAAEYEQFLTKRPDYKDRKSLERYIAENKKH